MVKLVFNQVDQIIKYKKMVDLLECVFHRTCLKPGLIYLMKTQEYNVKYPHSNEHIIGEDYTIKLADDKLYIISDHICSVIDLTKESPYEITAREV